MYINYLYTIILFPHTISIQFIMIINIVNVMVTVMFNLIIMVILIVMLMVTIMVIIEAFLKDLVYLMDSGFL